jgi:EmrB/QacA subfamily drug resistance transporter
MSASATLADAPAARPTRSPWVILAVLCLGLFMILLDGTIVNIAIPHIQTAFDTSFSNIEWVMNAYILAFAVLLVTMGRFGDLWGRRKLFVGGMVLFTLGSLACGLAPSIYLLIAFRVVQGIGGAAMMPSTLSIIASVFPADKRGAAMGVWGGVSGLASGLGPVLGGIIIQYVTWPSAAGSWRWIFLVNIPVGIVGVVLALRLVPESKNPTAVQTLDLPGVGLISKGRPTAGPRPRSSGSSPAPSWPSPSSTGASIA